MKAYKVFNSDWTCKGFQYEIGKTYEIKDSPVLCGGGFHACKKAIDCFNYYSFDPKNKVALVELKGDIIGENGDKQASNKITIIKEIKWNELLDIVNIGKGNTGNGNSGNWNSGYWNSGYWNSGNWNSGNRNSGNWNSGYWNSGNRNSGNGNSGNWNSGNRNSGNRNSGNWNSGNWNSGKFNSSNYNNGIFNSIDPEKMYAFNNILSKNKIEEIKRSNGYKICERFNLIKYRVRTKTGKYGDYRYFDYKTSWKILWSKLTINEKKSIRDIPYFDKNVFYEITGIKL